MSDPYYQQPQQMYPPPPQQNQMYPPQHQDQYNNYQQDQYNQNYQHQANYSIPNKDEKFTEAPKYQDKWAAIFFVVNFIVFTILSIITLKSHSPFGSNTSSSPLQYKLIAPFGASIVVSIVLSLLYLMLMQLIPALLIKLSFIGSILLTFISGIYIIMLKGRGGFIVGGLVILSGFLQIYLYFNWRSKIPFASLMLKSVSRFTKKYPGTIVVGLITMVLNLVYGLWWMITLLGINNKYGQKCTTLSNGRQRCNTPPQLYPLIVYLAFCVFWISQLLKDLTHTTIAGAFASDYFFPTSSRFGTFKSLKRSCSTSFGSVCFGSLLVSIVRLIRFLADQARSDSDNAALAFIGCCISCILAQIEHLIEYFNTYAYSYVAMYGSSYIQSGKQTWNLIKDRGVEAIINDSLISNVLSIGGLVISLVSAAIGYAVMSIVVVSKNNISTGSTIAVVVVCFILATIINNVVFQVIESSNTAFFVCLAEDPQCLQQTNPVLYNKILESYPQVSNQV